MTQDLVATSEKRNYGDLFVYDLNWGAPDHEPVQLTLNDGTVLTAANVSSYKGLRVWEVPAFPGAKVEALMDRMIAKTTTNRLVIFHEPARQAWRWPSRSSRGGGVVSRPARHVHRTGVPDPHFEEKLEAIRLPDDVLLDVNAVLTKVRAAFDVETTNETKRASKLMARMYTAVEKAYPTGYNAKDRDHEISVSLARILFLLFGDDTDMWAPEQFQEFIKDDTARDGSDVGQRINRLFEVLNLAPAQRSGWPPELAAFPHVNGGIFAERIQLPTLGRDFRDAVLDACAVDWSRISPAIFGSMFQSVRDGRTRRELGEHYTSEDNILRTLEPLFLDDLRAELNAALSRDTDRKKINSLRALWNKLGDVRFMDPACGCGNFIITAYKLLRQIELDVMFALQEIEGITQLSFDPKSDLRVTLDHFYGIEIDEWPARIAETAMYLVDRQCDLQLNERFGVTPTRLPIERSARIEVGSALGMDWSTILEPTANVVIAGNPPFLGHKERTREQGDELKRAWGTSKVQHLDYVTAWYAKTLEYFGVLAGRWAFVSTNSVCQGEGVSTLFRAILDAGWHIKFAHRSFKWESEAVGAAAVHVVIIGFERNPDRRRLFDYTGSSGAPTELVVDNISPYLVDGDDVLVDARRTVLSPVLPELRAGSTPIDWGHLMVEAEDLATVRADPIAARYLRRYSGGKELINGLEAWCLWMDEPGVCLADLLRSPELAHRIRAVESERRKSSRPATQRLAETPHLFGERRQPRRPYLGIPQTFAESRLYATAARVPAEVIASIKLFTHPDDDGFLFAMVSSTMFITWQKTIGGRLKSDPSFSSSLVWNTFPVPDIPADQRQEIVNRGAEILAARDAHPGETLAQLYRPNAMPEQLKAAHDNLDAAVDLVFGVERQGLTTLQRQEVLFSYYLSQSAGLLGT